MRIEAPRKIIEFGAYTAGKFAFPLLSHKRESDKAGKHQEWTRKKHIALNGLTFIVDLGFDYTTIMLAFFTNDQQAASMVKIAHVIGADAIPETLTNLKNKAVNRFEGDPK